MFEIRITICKASFSRALGRRSSGDLIKSCFHFTILDIDVRRFKTPFRFKLLNLLMYSSNVTPSSIADSSSALLSPVASISTRMKADLGRFITAASLGRKSGSSSSSLLTAPFFKFASISPSASSSLSSGGSGDSSSWAEENGRAGAEGRGGNGADGLPERAPDGSTPSTAAGGGG